MRRIYGDASHLGRPTRDVFVSFGPAQTNFLSHLGRPQIIFCLFWAGKKNIKYIFSEKDKLARFNPENILLKDIDHDKDILILKDVGHFPYFEDPDLISKELVGMIKGK